MSDLPYTIGDYSELLNHFDSYFGRAPWSLTTDSDYTHFYTLVDLLGTRFDSPKYNRAGWDLAALSMNRRPVDLKVPVYGGVGDTDLVFPAAWSRADASSLGGGVASNYHPKFFRNREHLAGWGFAPGVNEYSIWKGDEWSTLKNDAAATPATSNVSIAPPSSVTPPSPVYPTPYSHTLRHQRQAAVGVNLLSRLDLFNGMTNSGGSGLPRVPQYAKNSSIQWIGQGVYPGFRDSLHVGDFDHDGNMEAVFGDREGYVHVLEFAGTTDTTDPYRLVEEWRSPYLGPGLVGSDNYFAGNYAQMFFSDSKGQIWRIDATGPDTYTVHNSTPTNPAPVVVGANAHDLYKGATPILLVNNFDGSTKQIVALNRYLDFSMFNINGVPYTNGRRERAPRIVGPTDAFPIAVNPTQKTQKQILVAAADGNLWELDWDATFKLWTDKSAVGFTGLSLSKVVGFGAPVNGSGHVFALIFGSNDDRNDSDPTISTTVAQLWDLSNSPATLVTQVDTEEGTTSFAWITRPSASAPTGSFVVSGGALLQTFTITPGGGAPSMTPVQSVRVVPQRDSDITFCECITSVDVAPLAPAGASDPSIVFSTSSGRIFVMRAADLTYRRMSDAELGTGFFPSGPSNSCYSSVSTVPWPSNRTLARTYATDLYQSSADVTAGTASLFFAEYAQPAFHDDTSPSPPPTSPCPPVFNPHFRIGRIDLGAGAAPTNTWTAFADEARNDPRSGVWESELPDFNRRLMHQSVNGTVSNRMFAESGTAYYDSVRQVVREFQTSSVAASFFYANGNPGPGVIRQGGHVFELPPNRSFPYPSGYNAQHYGYLGGFTVKNGAPYYDFGSTGNSDCWWFPKVGTAFLSGQIAAYSQSADPGEFGCSMTHASLIPPGGAPANATEHVVVGTINGFVFAIDPGNQNPGGKVTSTLDYESINLGSFIVGLDTGVLDTTGTDTQPKIVCGTVIDDGTFVDWQTGSTMKNRGHLHILDPAPGTTTGTKGFNVTTLDADDLCGAGDGIGAGVTGVKIDDVNGDGVKEIWCGDALGHLYLFGQHDASGAAVGWHCLYRSEDLCCYPGFYNQIFPVKYVDPTTGKTITNKLIVNAPGYLMEFSVDWTQVH
jgi:hypothetical protein